MHQDQNVINIILRLLPIFTLFIAHTLDAAVLLINKAFGRATNNSTHLSSESFPKPEPCSLSHNVFSVCN